MVRRFQSMRNPSLLVIGFIVASAASAASLNGSPDPVQVCDGTGLGTITISWNAADTNAPRIEVHVGAPDGPTFAAGMAAGSAPTGKWTTNYTQFFRVDPAKKQVLAQYTAHVTTANCPAAQPKTFWQRLFGK